MLPSSTAQSPRCAPNGTCLVQRDCERHDAPAAAPPISRLDTRDAAEGGRLTDRSAGIRTCRAHGDARRHRRSRTAGRSARNQHAHCCPRAATDSPPARTPTSCWRNPWRTHRDSPCRETPRHRATNSPSPCFHTAARNCSRMRLAAVVRTPCGAEQILDRQRNAGERSRGAGSQRRVGRFRLRQRHIRRFRNVGVEPRVQLGHRIDMRLRQLARRKIAPPQRVAPPRQSKNRKASFHHFRHGKKFSRTVRRVGQNPLRITAIRYGILAQPQGDLRRRRSAAPRPPHPPRSVARSSPGYRSARPAGAAPPHPPRGCGRAGDAADGRGVERHEGKS